jgi:DNA-directed RNA polymerase specialized sigma24 family protein
MRRRLRSIRLDPSNRQVAEVLGVPKGTIDSNLYAVKSKWRTGDRPLS